MKVAVVQLNAVADKGKNLRKAEHFVKAAIRKRAEFIALPEVFNFRCSRTTAKSLQNIKERIPGESLKPLMALAKQHHCSILAGSLYEDASPLRKVYNTSVLIDRQGKICAKYRKINLFEAVVAGKRINEAQWFLAGRNSVVARVDNFRLGLSICYDVRFPALYRTYAQRGVHVICAPSAFTRATGQAHWEVLLRARAIENLCYVVAPNQVGLGPQNVRVHGHSMIIDPWGQVLAKASAHREEIIYGQVKMSSIVSRRKNLPNVLKN